MPISLLERERLQAETTEIPFGRPLIGEEERRAVLAALESPQLVHGPRAKEFEMSFASFIGPHATATSVSSCTAGLHLAYMHLGVGPGDEVIVPAQTHVATAHAVEVTGATPVFVDCEVATGNIDVAAIADAVTERTKAISVVHYLGLPVDMVGVNALARKHGLFVVEDCALAIGASLDGVSCGLLGDVGAFSFYPVKHMTTGEGGMVVSRRADVVASIENIKAFGYDRSPSERKVPGVYDVARLGLNYRMNEIAAAIGVEQLKKVTEFQRRRRANAAALRDALSGIGEITLLSAGDDRRVHGEYCLSVILDDSIAPRRPEIMDAMKGRGVGTSVYYPVPLPLSKYYRGRYGHRDGAFPNASKLSNNSIALPIGPHLREENMLVIAESLKSALENSP